MIPGQSPCCICGGKSTFIVGTGGGFDYTTCSKHYKLLWKAFDSENYEAQDFPMCFPEGTWAGTATAWQAAGFRVADLAEVSAWEKRVQSLPNPQ